MGGVRASERAEMTRARMVGPCFQVGFQRVGEIGTSFRQTVIMRHWVLHFYRNSKMKKWLFIFLCLPLFAPAQEHLLLVRNMPGDTYGYYALNVNTCEYCLLAQTSPRFAFQDAIVFEDGTIGFLRFLPGLIAQIDIYTPPSGSPTSSITIGTGTGYSDITLTPNGTIYLAAGANLYEYDLQNNTVTLLGSIPAPYTILNDLLYLNGSLYAKVSAAGGVCALMRINVGNVPASVVVHDPMAGFACGPINGIVSIPVGPSAGIFVQGDADPSSNLDFQIHKYDTTSNSTTFQCDIDNSYGGPLSYFPNPPNTACLCLTDAGQINTNNTFSACVGASITVPSATGVQLEANDLLQYILFSNPNDTLGSIIATSNTPTFNFNPATMQTDVTYYVAAIAGNNLNGNVDLSDPCLDISNAVQVTWRPRPTVTFSAANPNACAGACTTVTATFTGTAPFTLTYTSPASGTVTQTFSGNTGTFQICTSPGASPGSLVVQATKVLDAWCVCE